MSILARSWILTERADYIQQVQVHTPPSLSLSLSLSRTLIDSEECVSNKVSVASLSLYDSHTSVSITHTEQGMDEWEGESLWTEHIGEIVFER